jgi:hypothetical protein
MRRSFYFLFLFSCFLPSALNANSYTVYAIGEAYGLKDEEDLLYRETYCTDGDADKNLVIYQDKQGQLLARKQLDYVSGPFTPSFVQQNFYSDEIIEVDLQDDAVRMAVFKNDRSSVKRASEEPADQNITLVIDAGFDRFVRQHWDELLNDKGKTFLFAFVDNLKLLELRIQRAECSYSSENDQCFHLELSNWLFRLLAAPIELGYDPVTKNLSRYRGLSNIGDGNGNGNGLVVDIRYDYQIDSDSISGSICG